jgi:hypothetical protein
MIKMNKKVKQENMLKDTLYCLHPNSGCSIEEQKGIIRAAIGFYMGITGETFQSAVKYIYPMIPKECNFDQIVFDCWKEEFNKNKESLNFQNDLKENGFLGKEWINVSLSHATLKTEDIFEAVKFLLPENLVNDFESGNEEEKEIILNEDIFDYLNNISPIGCYFGSTEGDGSDFGFWENEEEEEDQL